jgi:uncharacterized protein (TIGR00290 family)
MSNESLTARSKKRALMSWSSGKDSAWALNQVLEEKEYEVVGLLTTLNQTHDRVAMHAVRSELLRAQSQALQLDLWEVQLPWPCSNEEYEEIMAAQMSRAVREEITHIIFGDLFLEDIRKYREARLVGTGITAVFPLWGRSTRELAHEMIDGGLVAHLTTVDPKQLDGGFVGRQFDKDFINELPEGVDACGENGEFHSFVSALPAFDAPLPIRRGESLERDGYWFCDFDLKPIDAE